MDYFEDILTKNMIKSVKRNKVKLKPEKRDESNRLVSEF